MGKIKKILENELVGGTQTTDVYPVTSTKAVYDENNKRLDEILSASDKKLTELESQVIYDVSANNDRATFDSLSALLSSENLSTLIPTAVRCGGMNIRFVQSSDNKYVQYRLTTDEWSTDTEDWAIAEEGVYVENPEFIYVKTDKEGKILWAIRTNGGIYYGAGCPEQVKDYIEEKISSLSLDEYEDIVAFLSDYLGSDTTLKVMIDGINATKLDKEGLDSDALGAVQAIENPEWVQVTTDSEGKVLEGITKDGKKKVMIETLFKGKTISNIIDNNFKNKSTLDKFSENNGQLLWNNNPIEGNGITQEQADERYADKSVESIVGNHTTQINSISSSVDSIENSLSNHASQINTINNTVDSIEQNVETINGALSDLTSPLPSGAITGDNVWTGANKFTQAIVGVAGTNDNNVALYGQFKNTLNRLIDAADYGFNPNNSGSDNARALQTAVNGGNKTVTISKPGEYLIGDTVLLDDNTTLVCGKGVILKKASASFVHILLNRGASARTTNKNISIIGGTYCINNNDALHDNDINTPLWGLRGLLAFVCIENLIIDGVTIPDLMSGQYAIHINSFNTFVVKNTIIEGNKDAIHFSDGEHFTISHCYLNTNDDVVAMNASDWVTSNCVDGTIKYGLIEDCITKGNGRFLMNVGGIVDWHEGMNIQRGDRVVSNGNVYKAIDVPSSIELQSKTQPTIETYTGYQADEAGFKWKLMRKTPFYTTNVERITIRNCHSYTTRIAEGCSNELTIYSRELYPEVPVENYPNVDFIVENCVFDTTMMNYNVLVNDNIIFKNTKLPNIGFSTFGKNQGVKGKTVLENCDFSNLSSLPYDITTGYNVHLVIKGAKYSDCIRFDENLSRGRLESDYPCDATRLIGEQKKGDIIRAHDGTPKIYDGSNWIDLI